MPRPASRSRPSARPAVPTAPRPVPPPGVGRLEPERTVPDLALMAWIRAEFITGGAFHNGDHDHLRDATLGAVWTNVTNRSRQLYVLAECRQPTVQGGAWLRARHDQQLEEWFGSVPDFLLTFYAPTLAQLPTRDFCAIVDHELYHAAHATTDLGNPRFHRDTGKPIYAVRGHDVEEFVGVVRRWGASGPVRELVAAAQAAGDRISDTRIEGACGTCGGHLTLAK